MTSTINAQRAEIGDSSVKGEPSAELIDLSTPPPTKRKKTTKIKSTKNRQAIEPQNSVDQNQNLTSAGLGNAQSLTSDFTYVANIDTTVTSPRICDANNLPPAITSRVSTQILDWEAKHGPQWLSIVQIGSRGRSCVDRRLNRAASNRRSESGSRFACRDCAKSKKLCFEWDGKGKFELLPLHPADRVIELREDQICAERWVKT